MPQPTTSSFRGIESVETDGPMSYLRNKYRQRRDRRRNRRQPDGDAMINPTEEIEELEYDDEASDLRWSADATPLDEVRPLDEVTKKYFVSLNEFVWLAHAKNIQEAFIRLLREKGFPEDIIRFVQGMFIVFRLQPDEFRFLKEKLKTNPNYYIRDFTPVAETIDTNPMAYVESGTYSFRVGMHMRDDEYPFAAIDTEKADRYMKENNMYGAFTNLNGSLFSTVSM